MATAAENGVREVEADVIIRWRTEQLRRAGYAERSALLLALRTDVDLHVAMALLAQGCPQKVALRILL